MKGHIVPTGYWTDADGHSADDWCYDHMTGNTFLTYWEWVAERRTKEQP